jgi:hypothetical protein
LRPEAEPTDRTVVTVLNSGRRGDAATALIDLGPRRRVLDRIELIVSGRDFVGRATVLGSNDRETFTNLGSTTIYDVAGATRARSTVVELPPSDFRYYELRATGVRSIDGAAVSSETTRPALIRRDASERVRQQGRTTVVTLDLRHARIPIDELRVRSSTEAYDRPLQVSGSNDGRRYVPLFSTRLTRYEGSPQGPLAFTTRHRYLRLEIDNGDDRPLAGLSVEAFARSRAILVSEARDGLRVYYGDPSLRSPDYDFARLPAATLRDERAAQARLGPERPNPDFDVADTRSFVDEHGWVLQAALAAAALVVGLGAFLALRRRA